MINVAITSYDLGNPPMFKGVGGFPHLSVQQYQSILKYFEEQDITNFNIIGGEPSIHADLDLILSATNKFANRHPQARINLYTSGYDLIDHLAFLGLNIKIVLQWFEDDSKTSSTMEKNSLQIFQKLYELNYFAQKRAILEIPLGVVERDHSLILSLIKQYNIPVVQIRFSPLYAEYDTEKNYEDLKRNFFILCKQLSTKIIINPVDTIPWCQFSQDEKEFLKNRHITYPVQDDLNIIFYADDSINTHVLDKVKCPYHNNDYQNIVQTLKDMRYNEEKFSMCMDCSLLNKKKCLGRRGY